MSVWALSKRIEKAEAALRRISQQKLGEETWDDLLAVATGCIEEARAALRDTAPAEEPEAVGLLKRWRAHAGEGFQDVISVRYLTNETDAFLALPAPAEEPKRDFSWFRGSVDKELLQKLVDMERDPARPSPRSRRR